MTENKSIIFVVSLPACVDNYLRSNGGRLVGKAVVRFLLEVITMRVVQVSPGSYAACGSDKTHEHFGVSAPVVPKAMTRLDAHPHIHCIDMQTCPQKEVCMSVAVK